MKKDNRVLGEIKYTSLQTQLFSIILMCFILFILFNYLIIVYAFRNRYIEYEVNSSISEVEELSKNINEGDGNLTLILNNYYEKSGAIPLFIDASGGGYKLIDPIYTSYEIKVNDGIEDYTIKLESYDIDVKVGDEISGYISLIENSTKYTYRSLTIGSVTYENEIATSSTLELDHASVIEVKLPININFLHESTEKVKTGLNLLDSDIDVFVERKGNASSYLSYYTDDTNGYLYILTQPNKYRNTNTFILIVTTHIETDSLLNIVSSYFGYVVLISIVIAVLIAVFISRVFSTPVRIIEKEMKKLALSNYETSSYNFKNKELVSLESTLNEVKKDTKEKVENIENQKESLEKLNEELKKEGELRSSFIARLSHELKTPLMVISATTEAFMSGLIKEEDELKEYNTILNEIDKTTGIIKDIINTYKTSTKELTLNVSRFDLGLVIKNTLSTLLPIAQGNKLNVIENVNSGVFIDADEELIKQVVSNFITNAFKYTKEENKIEINLIDNKNEVKFEVRNYGSHINEENLDKIWLPFFREKENVDSSSTGMGLYIVKEILTKHNYEFDVTNFDGGVLSYFIVKR